MKKKVWYGLIAAVVIVCGIVLLNTQMHKNEKTVEDFLKTAFAKTEENTGLYEQLQAGGAVMGEGVDEETQKESIEKSKEAEDAFQKAYGKYMNDSCLEEFLGVYASYVTELHSESETCEVSEVQVEEDAEAYKFQVTLTVDGAKRELTGRSEVTDGKISGFELTQY